MELRVSESPARPTGASWIDRVSDEECAEIFWLYVDPPEEFLNSHPPALLGAAMRYALRTIYATAPDAPSAGR